MKRSKAFRKMALVLMSAALTFSLAVCAQAQTVRFLAEFTNPNDSPNGMIQGTDGNLYGTGYWSGAFGFGDVFRMTPSGHLTTIYSFPCEGTCAEGRNPILMVLGSDGNFYGVTVYGGEGASGTFYKVTPGGKFTLLHTFCSDSTCSDGKNPNGLFLGNDGNLYGTTAYGGEWNQGVFFRISPTGNFKDLHSFCALSNCQDGSFPLSPIQGQDGKMELCSN